MRLVLFLSTLAALLALGCAHHHHSRIGGASYPDDRDRQPPSIQPIPSLSTLDLPARGCVIDCPGDLRERICIRLQTPTAGEVLYSWTSLQGAKQAIATRLQFSLRPSFECDIAARAGLLAR